MSHSWCDMAYICQVFFFYYDTLVFDNLLSLSIECDEEKGWQVMARLFDNSPNLEYLIIKVSNLIFRISIPCCHLYMSNDCPFRVLSTKILIGVETRGVEIRPLASLRRIRRKYVVCRGVE